MMLHRYGLAICVLAFSGAYAADARVPEAPVTAPEAGDAAPAPGTKVEFTSAYDTYRQLIEAKKSAEALPYAKEAYRLGSEIYGAEHKNTAALALNLGGSLQETGHRKEAVAMLDTAVSLYQRIYGKDAIEMIDPLMARGDAANRTQ